MAHPTTERWHEAIGEGFTAEDDGQLLDYMDAVGDQLGDVDDLVRDTDTTPGWGTLFDIDLVDAAHLAFLAQWVGARFPGGLSEAEQRAYAQARPGWGRGRPAAILAAAAAQLTGSKTVVMFERDGGNAYQLRVRTYDAETPDPAAVEAAVRAVKPGGIVLTYESVAAGSYAEASASPVFLTYADAAAYFGTYDDASDWLPGEEVP